MIPVPMARRNAGALIHFTPIHPMIRRTAAALLFACAALAAPAAAQTADTTGLVRMQALSILPFHALLGFYAGDFERVVGETATLGLGSSRFNLGEEDGFTYTTAEAKLRYYPSGDPLRGLSFGVTAGPTIVTAGEAFTGGGKERYTAVGVGFEVARSHIMGVDQRFYYGYGLGGKRLYFVDEVAEGVQLVLPTLRLSAGYAF